MITVTLAAKHIPDGQGVRKPTGATFYTLRHEIQIYGDDGRTIYPPEGVCFLCGESSDSGILEDRQLSIDFDTPGDVVDWIDRTFPGGEYE